MVLACGEAAPLTSDPTGTDWELTKGAVDGQAIPLVSGYPITLSFTEDAAGGTSACNGYGGTYTIAGETLRFSAMGGTEMACSPQAVMDSETAYLAALVRVERIAIDQRLTLTGDGVELVFEQLPPVPTAELTGTVWVLDGLVDGDSVSSVRGERATLELFTDGSMLGSTGCRGLSGHYVISGGEVQFTDFAADGECPSDLFDQDDHVVAVLGDGFRADVDGGTLTIVASGHQGLTYTTQSVTE